MKSLFVLPVIFIAVVVASILFAQRGGISETDKHIDDVSNGLKGIEKVLPPQSNISYLAKDVNNDIYLWARYLLAPRYVSVNAKERFDTTLVVCRADANDSVVRALTADKKIIWSNKDNPNYYFLVSGLFN